jgi:hypothetical protein
MEGSALNNVFNFPSLRGKPGPDMTIAWEIQPSLQHRVVRAASAPPDAPVWADTMPAAFDALDDPLAFSEPMQGLSIRDIHEPEVFRAFFGDARGATRG